MSHAPFKTLEGEVGGGPKSTEVSSALRACEVLSVPGYRARHGCENWWEAVTGKMSASEPKPFLMGATMIDVGWTGPRASDMFPVYFFWQMPVSAFRSCSHSISVLMSLLVSSLVSGSSRICSISSFVR